MLLRLTSVKEVSLFFILCRDSSTFVGLGGSSNTGFIFSPLITSVKPARHRFGTSTWPITNYTYFTSFLLTVVALFSSRSTICLTTGDQSVNTEDCCEEANRLCCREEESAHISRIHSWMKGIQMSRKTSRVLLFLHQYTQRETEKQCVQSQQSDSMFYNYNNVWTVSFSQ